MRDPWGYWSKSPDEQADLIAYHQILHAPHEEQQTSVRSRAKANKSVTLQDLKWYLSHPTIYRDMAYYKMWENGKKTPSIPYSEREAMLRNSLKKEHGSEYIDWLFKRDE